VYTVYMKPESTRQRIVAAARGLLDQQGSEGITMRRVAKAVGITPMAVYRHFADREDLVNGLADDGFEELATLLATKVDGAGVQAQLLTLAEVYLDHALANPRLFELMFLRPRAGARRYPTDFKDRRSPTANLIAQVVQQGMREGKFQKDDAWQIVLETGALSHGLIMLYLGGRIALPASEFRKLYRRAFRRYIRGISK
jgi:AcrR family transcriptional regulator